MAITVRFPSTLGGDVPDTVEIQQPVTSVGELVAELDRRFPGLRRQLDDSVFNFAVNDRMLLHAAREHALQDGDVVEIVPAISGG